MSSASLWLSHLKTTSAKTRSASVASDLAATDCAGFLFSLSPGPSQARGGNGVRTASIAGG